MSIASRITSIEGHISDIYDSVELTGVDTTDIDKNLVNVPNTLKEGYIDIINNGTDTLYNNFPKVSGEGTSLTLNNTYQAPMRNFLKGNTSQTGTPTPTSPIDVNVVSGDNEIQVCGKNLCNNDIILSFFLNFTNSTIGEAEGSKTMYAKVPKNTDITISRATLTNRFRIGLLNEIPQNGGTFYLAYIGDSSSDLSKTINSGNYEYVAVQYTNQSENTNIQIEKSNQATNFEPYQGNTYNIDLPVENLLPNPSNSGSSTGAGNMSLTWNTNNEYKLSGNATRSANVVGGTIATDYTIKEGDYLHLCNDSTPSGVIQFVGLTPQSAQAFVVTINSKNKVLDLTSYVGKTIHSVFFYCVSGASADMTMTPMIVNGISKETSFTPFGTTPIELCKIGNYQDYIYKDSDKWYLYKAIGKVVLNGSEASWYSASTQGGGTRYEYRDNSFTDTIENNVAGPILSNYFGAISVNQTYTSVVGVSYKNKGSKGLYIYDGTNQTLADFKTWLSTHSTSVYYVLATPTITQITYQPLIYQLEAWYQAKSKNGQTNISQINNDLPFIIYASALKKGV